MHALTAEGLHIVLGYSTPQWSRWEVRRKPPRFRGHGGWSWDSGGVDAQEQSFTDMLKSGNVDSSILLEMARNDPCARCRLQSVKNSERSGFFFATPFPFTTHSPTPNSKPGPEARPVPSIFLPYLACKENESVHEGRRTIRSCSNIRFYGVSQEDQAMGQPPAPPRRPCWGFSVMFGISLR